MRALLKQTKVWKMLRAVKRRVSPPACVSVPIEQRRGTVDWLNVPPAAEARQRYAATVRVQNLGATIWAGSATEPLQLQARWLKRDGQPFDQEPMRLTFATPLFPAEPQEVVLELTMPDVVGDFALEIAVIRGTTVLVQAAPIALPIVGPRSSDIDYHAVYRTANLQENHWWVVGAYHTQEQYERSSHDRLEMLQKQGLTPDSWLLDIGCGTGQMAKAMLGYVSAKGGYSGCDIGQEAIAFCQDHFHQPNFHFAQSGMTSVPFTTNGTHDMAIFFSVFTHTYTDETALLLAEAKRLLKPNGVIIADVITSELVERGAGHRGEMTVNARHFERIAAMLGYECNIIGSWPWNRHAVRHMYLLRPLTK